MHAARIDPRRGMLLGAGLGAVLLSRLPFFPALPLSFDALNYMRALEHMDVRLHQPQPPGYPLYVLLGRALLLLTGEPHRALLWLSALACLLAGGALYALGKSLIGERGALLAALFLLTAPAVWYQSEIAAPYTLDLLASIGVALLAYRTLTEEGTLLPWATAFALGMSGAFRPQTMVFLAPLVAFALMRRGWRALFGGAALAGVVFALGFAPLIAASGGWEGYRAALGHITEIPSWGMPHLEGGTRLGRNALVVLRLTFGAMSEPLWLLALGGLAAALRKPKSAAPHPLAFFLLWVAPAWTVYVLLWPGNRGTILVGMAPFYLLAAWGAEALIQRRAALGWGVSVAAVIWQILLFTSLPQQPFGPAWRRYDNAETLRWKEAYYRNRLEAVARLPVEGTLVYAVEFRHLQTYLPQYHTFSPPIFDPQGSGEAVSIIEIREGERLVQRRPALESLIPPETRRILLFDLPAEVIHAPPEWVTALSVPQAPPLILLTLPPGARARWTPEGIRAGEEGGK